MIVKIVILRIVIKSVKNGLKNIDLKNNQKWLSERCHHIRNGNSVRISKEIII